MDDLTKKRLEKQGVGTHRIKAMEYLENNQNNKENLFITPAEVAQGIKNYQKMKKGVKTDSNIPKIEIDYNKVKEIADRLIADYNAENKELTIEHSKKIEELDQKHQDWINKNKKNID